jgi:hypothetical protein
MGSVAELMLKPTTDAVAKASEAGEGLRSSRQRLRCKSRALWCRSQPTPRELIPDIHNPFLQASPAELIGKRPEGMNAYLAKHMMRTSRVSWGEK